MVTRTTKNTFPKKETKKRSNFFEDKNETFTYLQGLKYIYLYDRDCIYKSLWWEWFKNSDFEWYKLYLECWFIKGVSLL